MWLMVEEKKMGARLCINEYGERQLYCHRERKPEAANLPDELSLIY